VGATRRHRRLLVRQHQIDFRVDEMNDDEAFSRVRVRKQLLPLMKSFNNRVVEALSRTACVAQRRRGRAWGRSRAVVAVGE